MVKHKFNQFLAKDLSSLSLSLISLTIIVGSLIYYSYKLNNLGIFLSLVLIFAIFSIIIKQTKGKAKKQLPNQDRKQKKWGENIVVLLYLLSVLFNFYILFQGRTSQSLISPWTKIPSYFFFTFWLSLLFLFLLIIIKGNRSLIFIKVQYFLSLSLLLIIYKIGYGFDPFIHEANLKLIEKKGVVEPKTFYYIGQYSLILIFHKLTFISISFWNKILLPLLAALFLPSVLGDWLNKYLGDSKANKFLLLLILILPFSWAIITIPQNLAYLFLILTIFSGLGAQSKLENTATCLLALATFFIHPLAGIPALLFLAGLLFKINLNFKPFISRINFLYSKKFVNFFYGFLFLLSALIIPLVFLFLNGFKLKNYMGELSIPELTVPGSENFILNFIYFPGFNYKIIVAVLVVAGIIIFLKNKKNFPLLKLNLGLGVAFLISFLITKIFVPFQELIKYEEGYYSQRILLVAIIFLSPFIFLTLRALTKKLKQEKLSVSLPIILFLSFFILASLYLSYPRLDNYHNSHGQSVSSSDLKAVNWIENDAAGEDYIVLANQQVSVAALRELGFDHYFKKDIYFYPIPTGGELYQYYLNMVYEKPERKYMRQATELAGAEKGYLVLNKYWWAFDKIKKEAKLEADSYRIIDEGKIYIFEFNFSS